MNSTNKLHHAEADKPALNVYKELNKINSNIHINSNIKVRSRNGGFVSWPENMKNCVDNETLHRRSRCGGFVSWPQQKETA